MENAPVRDFIPLGIGIHTTGPDPKKHNLLEIAFVSYHNGARFSINIRHSDMIIDLEHCKDFWDSLQNSVARDADLADEEIDRFLTAQAQVQLEDRPAARIMKLIPMGVGIEKSKAFIEKILPQTYNHLWHDASLELSSLFAIEGLRDSSELAHVQGQYRNRSEVKLMTTEGLSPALREAYLANHMLSDFRGESPNWMAGR